jgi:hypothetical protein
MTSKWLQTRKLKNGNSDRSNPATASRGVIGKGLAGFLPTTKEALLQIWANYRQRALDTAIAELNAKTNLAMEIESILRPKHRRITALNFSIKAKAETAK